MLTINYAMAAIKIFGTQLCWILISFHGLSQQQTHKILNGTAAFNEFIRFTSVNFHCHFLFDYFNVLHSMYAIYRHVFQFFLFTREHASIGERTCMRSGDNNYVVSHNLERWENNLRNQQKWNWKQCANFLQFKWL